MAEIRTGKKLKIFTGVVIFLTVMAVIGIVTAVALMEKDKPELYPQQYSYIDETVYDDTLIACKEGDYQLVRDGKTVSDQYSFLKYSHDGLFLYFDRRGGVGYVDALGNLQKSGHEGIPFSVNAKIRGFYIVERHGELYAVGSGGEKERGPFNRILPLSDPECAKMGIFVYEKDNRWFLTGMRTQFSVELLSADSAAFYGGLVIADTLYGRFAYDIEGLRQVSCLTGYIRGGLKKGFAADGGKICKWNDCEGTIEFEIKNRIVKLRVGRFDEIRYLSFSDVDLISVFFRGQSAAALLLGGQSYVTAVSAEAVSTGGETAFVLCGGDGVFRIYDKNLEEVFFAQKNPLVSFDNGKNCYLFIEGSLYSVQNGGLSLKWANADLSLKNLDLEYFEAEGALRGGDGIVKALGRNFRYDTEAEVFIFNDMQGRENILSADMKSRIILKRGETARVQSLSYNGTVKIFVTASAVDNCRVLTTDGEIFSSEFPVRKIWWFGDEYAFLSDKGIYLTVNGKSVEVTGDKVYFNYGGSAFAVKYEDKVESFGVYRGGVRKQAVFYGQYELQSLGNAIMVKDIRSDGFGLINAKGQLAVKPFYSGVAGAGAETAMFCSGGYFIMTDLKGKELLKTEGVSAKYVGRYAAVTNGGKTSLIDERGKTVLTGITEILPCTNLAFSREMNAMRMTEGRAQYYRIKADGTYRLLKMPKKWIYSAASSSCQNSVDA